MRKYLFHAMLFVMASLFAQMPKATVKSDFTSMAKAEEVSHYTT